MQINKELLERALVEGVDCSHNLSAPLLPFVSLATELNNKLSGFHLTTWGSSTPAWIYVCNYEEYLKAKAEKEKMQEFKVGDLVDVVNMRTGKVIGRKAALRYLNQFIVVDLNGTERVYEVGFYSIKRHRKTQSWFGVEIDAFMTEKPKDGKLYYLWSLCGDVVEPNGWADDDFDSRVFDMGVWDSEEKAQRSVPLMRQRLIEMAGVSCKEK